MGTWRVQYFYIIGSHTLLLDSVVALSSDFTKMNYFHSYSSLIIINSHHLHHIFINLLRYHRVPLPTNDGSIWNQSLEGVLYCCTVVVLLHCWFSCWISWPGIFRGLEVGWSRMGPWDTSKLYAPVRYFRGLEVGCSHMGPWDTSKFYSPVRSTRPVPLVWSFPPSNAEQYWFYFPNIGFPILGTFWLLSFWFNLQNLQSNVPVGLWHVSAGQGNPDGEGEHGYCSKKFPGF